MFLIRFLLADLLLHFLFITGLRGARGAVEVDIVLFGIHGSSQRAGWGHSGAFGWGGGCKKPVICLMGLHPVSLTVRTLLGLGLAESSMAKTLGY